MGHVKKRESMHGLGSLQAEVMDVVWKLGKATVSVVHEQIAKRRPVTYTTVLVAMQKLEKKGWLTHSTRGRAYVYRPVKSKQQADVGILKQLLQTAFGGDPKTLLSHLLDAHPMDEDELTSLKKLIDARRKEKRHERSS